MTAEISVVIPVKDAEATLERCLQALAGNAHLREIVFVDDGCSDRSCEIARKYPLVKIVTTPTDRRGVAAARNIGAREATGSIILFIDSDIVVKEDSLTIIHEAFSQPEVNAIVGLLDPETPYTDFASDYKNLWIHYTYTIQREQTALFYTSIAAIRRSVFLANKGFDEQYRKPGLEDTEFGNRLHDAGIAVLLLRKLMVIHLKNYRLGHLFRLDFNRARALVMIQLRRGSRAVRTGNLSSVPLSFILSIVPAFLTILLALPGIVMRSPLLLTGAMVAAGICWTLNARFLAFLHAIRGAFFALKAALFLIADSSVLVAGVFAAFIDYYRGKPY